MAVSSSEPASDRCLEASCQNDHHCPELQRDIAPEAPLTRSGNATKLNPLYDAGEMVPEQLSFDLHIALPTTSDALWPDWPIATGMGYWPPTLGPLFDTFSSRCGHRRSYPWRFEKLATLH